MANKLRTGVLAWLLFALSAWTNLQADTQPAAITEPLIEIIQRAPRDFGFHLGDLAEQQFQLTLPAGERLNVNTLPSRGRLNDWLDVRAFEHEVLNATDEAAAAQANAPITYQLTFHYQLFKQVDQTSTVKIPPTTVLLASGKKVVLPAWPITVGRLLPADYERTKVLAQPAVAQTTDTRPAERWRNILLGALVMTTLIWLWLADKLPFLNPPSGPFTRANRAIKRLPASDDGRRAITQLQQALAQDAGETVFPDQLDAYFAAKPHYRPLQDSTRQLLDNVHKSRFASRSPADLPTREQVATLCQQFSRLEQQQWKR